MKRKVDGILQWMMIALICLHLLKQVISLWVGLPTQFDAIMVLLLLILLKVW